MEGLSHVSDMNPVIFNTTPVSRALLRTGGGWTYAADRNQLAHTVQQQLGLQAPLRNPHCLPHLPSRQKPLAPSTASPVVLQAGASQEVLEPDRVWIRSPESQPVAPQVPYWSGEFLRGCWQGGISE